tara:strand:- start:570 stop:797 length:228 start_codon:yes stop_codon:yes gene_type:complete
MSKSDPFLIIYKKKNLKPGEKMNTGNYHGEMYTQDWVAVHKTETVKDNLNPTWRPFKARIHFLDAFLTANYVSSS